MYPFLPGTQDKTVYEHNLDHKPWSLSSLLFSSCASTQRDQKQDPSIAMRPLRPSKRKRNNGNVQPETKRQYAQKASRKKLQQSPLKKVLNEPKVQKIAIDLYEKICKEPKAQYCYFNTLRQLERSPELTTDQKTILNRSTPVQFRLIFKKIIDKKAQSKKQAEQTHTTGLPSP